MYFATALITSLVAAIVASNPVQADISLPLIGNYSLEEWNMSIQRQ
jgi:hypothetical protein